jgi:predicted RNA binding protein YcfA (HicA-like mRNA interferase family)
VSVGFDEANHPYYVLSSDIPGLHVETETFEDFVEAVCEVAPTLWATKRPDRKSASNAKSNSRSDRTQSLSELTKLLSDAGFTLIRQGKGSHEIWFSPITHRKFVVPKNTIMVHTANGVLKDAGLPKAF